MNTSFQYAGNPLIYKFRFLYGRWIRFTAPGHVFLQLGSDSSMVDEYPANALPIAIITAVQIPLWSMNTRRSITTCLDSAQFRFLYGRWILLLDTVRSIADTGSDSSMVDEYASIRFRANLSSLVQIPLWSVNTDDHALLKIRFYSSDSSMVDEYDWT